MKILLRLSAVLLGVGILASVACDGCSQNEDDTGTGIQQQSMTCGQGTHRVGNQCVNDVAPRTTTDARP